MFQSTLPRRERLYPYDLFHCIYLFQSTLPRRERPAYFEFWLTNPLFQSTLPRRERRIHRHKAFKSSLFQSTLPRRERHIAIPFQILIVFVSIHAPTKGATWTSEGWDKLSEFQSTLPRRERRHRTVFPAHKLGFNPRSHEGSDDLVLVPVLAGCVSIHAPTKGATVPDPQAESLDIVSIHAPTKGATWYI